MPPRHPDIASALGRVRRRLTALNSASRPLSIHVGCSGGPDSIALLGLLHLVARPDGLRVSVGHVDHGLRPESAREASLVEDVAGRLELPVAVTRLELTLGPGLPARARTARREALWAQAEARDARVLALGHTATDQAETMLLHLTRGAALEGLAAMAEFDPRPDGGGVVRPLLDLRRDQTRALAQRLELPFVDDPTNDDLDAPRVLMRQRVLPLLAGLNPRVEDALARSAAHAREAEDALMAWVDELLRSRRRPITAEDGSLHEGQAHEPGQGGDEPPVTSAARWSTEGMEELPRAVRTRFVRRLCTASGTPGDGLAASTLASIDHALAHPGPRRSWDLHPHRRLCIADGELWMEETTAAERAANH